MRTGTIGALLGLLLAVAGCTSSVDGSPAHAAGSGDTATGGSPSDASPTDTDNPDNTGSSIDESLACIQGAVEARQILDLFDDLKHSDPLAKWQRTADRLEEIRRKLGKVAGPLPAHSKLKAVLGDIREELRQTAIILRVGTYDIDPLLRHIDRFKRICSDR